MIATKFSVHLDHPVRIKNQYNLIMQAQAFLATRLMTTVDIIYGQALDTSFSSRHLSSYSLDHVLVELSVAGAEGLSYMLQKLQQFCTILCLLHTGQIVAPAPSFPPVQRPRLKENMDDGRKAGWGLFHGDVYHLTCRTSVLLHLELQGN